MGEVKLHIGCGKQNWPEWVGIDAANYPHVKWNDVTKLRYLDNSVSEIYSSHLIAYFDREEIVPILTEWFRVLAPGGMIKLSTPDWDALRKLPRPLTGPLYGKMSNPPIYHKTVYSYDELYQVLRAAGFIDIVRVKWDELYGMSDQSVATYDGELISLNVKAKKP